ncbi:hypothetical protein EBR25_13605 [bacterium]|nr:hypothetical protein [bacterium]
MPELKRKDEGQREHSEKIPIELEIPVPHSSKRDYLALLWCRYNNSNTRAEKSKILDEICRNLGYHRNSSLRLMNRDEPPKLGRGKGSSAKKYSEEAKSHLKRLWRVMGRPAGRKMREMLPDWLYFDQEQTLTQKIKQELMTMSKSSIDNFLKPARAQWRRERNTGTKPARAKVKTLVPVKPMSFRAKKVGTIETDTVAHCGEHLSGNFYWSLCWTDLKSTWTEAAVVWNKQSLEVKRVLERAESESFFSWEMLCSDSGTEFLNKEVVIDFCKDPRREKPLLQVRGRPYKKNDQCFIEQKNNVFVRQLLGYGRLDSRKMGDLLNQTYRDWGLLRNHFVPTTKLLSKIRVGSKIKKEYDQPKTPYERLLEDPDVSPEQKERLIAEHMKLNPFELRRRVLSRLKVIHRWHDIQARDRGGLTA